ncbi:MAG TPA: type II toxin-antitoxin system RelE/ParE family toxin [Acidobacteriaceae bacterium]|nr:type II toxin-antitoxin system RelE/ParE family toxin [Acidobacteriaceae bacterium]
MIQSFKDDEAQTVYNTGRSKKYGSLARVIARRLGAIDFATSLEDLRDPPGNRLELLKGDRKGQYSIRVNDRYRACFRWQENDAWDVEIVDYH